MMTITYQTSSLRNVNLLEWTKGISSLSGVLSLVNETLNYWRIIKDSIELH